MNELTVESFLDQSSTFFDRRENKRLSNVERAVLREKRQGILNHKVEQRLAEINDYTLADRIRLQAEIDREMSVMIRQAEADLEKQAFTIWEKLGSRAHPSASWESLSQSEKDLYLEAAYDVEANLLNEIFD